MVLTTYLKELLASNVMSNHVGILEATGHWEKRLAVHSDHQGGTYFVLIEKSRAPVNLRIWLAVSSSLAECSRLWMLVGYLLDH